MFEKFEWTNALPRPAVERVAWNVNDGAIVKTHRGIIHGRTIQLDALTGFADGVEVEIVIRPSRQNRQAGDGLRRTEGALADDSLWDGIMDEVHAARKIERHVPSHEE